ncbi:MAG: hypothetical protein AAF222_00960 [Pseudomonadota bacterium]
MIWSILLGLAAGWGASSVEDRLRPWVEQSLPGGAPGPGEMRAIALAICVFVAALVAAFSGGGGAVPLSLGALLGVLGPRLYAKIKAMRAPDYDS